MNRFVTLALVCTVALSVASHAFGQEEKPSAAEITKLLPGKVGQQGEHAQVSAAVRK